MSDALKPCPFCGRLPTVFPFSFGGASRWGFRCCMIDGGRSHRTRESVVERWNTRAAIADAKEAAVKDAAS